MNLNIPGGHPTGRLCVKCYQPIQVCFYKQVTEVIDSLYA